MNIAAEGIPTPSPIASCFFSDALEDGPVGVGGGTEIKVDVIVEATVWMDVVIVGLIAGRLKPCEETDSIEVTLELPLFAAEL